jgi:bifunctional non-homologous end joining protein LigD
VNVVGCGLFTPASFELLWRDGDFRNLPEVQRKQTLFDLLGENDAGLSVIYSEHLIGDR